LQQPPKLAKNKYQEKKLDPNLQYKSNSDADSSKILIRTSHISLFCAHLNIGKKAILSTL